MAFFDTAPQTAINSIQSPVDVQGKFAEVANKQAATGLMNQQAGEVAQQTVAKAIANQVAQRHLNAKQWLTDNAAAHTDPPAGEVNTPSLFGALAKAGYVAEAQTFQTNELA